MTSDALRLELLVFVEGETENQYVKEWHKRHREWVNVEIDPSRISPFQLVQKAVEAKNRESHDARRGRGRSHDQFWCVFDRDEHARLPEAFQLADANGIRIAFSNPCLELWFVLHFRDQAAHVERHPVQADSAGYLHCRKNLTRPALDVLVDQYEVAKKRALLLDAKHAGDGTEPRGNPSTDVWKLVDEIRGSRPDHIGVKADRATRNAPG
ncbi:MAG: RloB family protein [Actinocrinis sp.]